MILPNANTLLLRTIAETVINWWYFGRRENCSSQGKTAVPREKLQFPGKNCSSLGKTSHSRRENQQINPHMVSSPESYPGHMVGTQARSPATTASLGCGLNWAPLRMLKELSIQSAGEISYVNQWKITYLLPQQLLLFPQFCQFLHQPSKSIQETIIFTKRTGEDFADEQNKTKSEYKTEKDCSTATVFLNCFREYERMGIEKWMEMTRDRKYRSMFKKGGLDNNVGSTNINDKKGGKSLRKKGICRTFHKNNFLIIQTAFTKNS